MLHNNRFYILLVSFLFSIGVPFLVTATASESVQISRMSQIYALTSVAFLYLSLLIGPLCYTVPNLPFSSQIKHSRRALGVAAFYFALLHASISFFRQLGGFEGLPYLSGTYIFNITIGAISLFILYLLAITSFDFVIKKITFPKWKLLHRFVYLAGILILIHALMLGTHFRSLNEYIPQIFFSALAVLIFLEGMRFDAFLNKKFKNLPQFGVTVTLVVSLMFGFYMYTLLPNSNVSPLSTHNQHAQQTPYAQTDYKMSAAMSQYPGMDGDKTKRYTVGFNTSGAVEPNQDVTFSFPVYEATNGERVEYYKNFYEKSSHLIIVDSSLTYFSHIHPTPTEDGFTITTQFPRAGKYHLYLNFQPLGAIEQQMAFTVQVGSETDSESLLNGKGLDTNLTKRFGDYSVTLDTQPPFAATSLTAGQQQLSLTIKDAAKKPVTTLKPYLGAFGHLVMINQKTYDYFHIHPANPKPPGADEMSGPTVTFMPMGMYGQIKPGIYRMFGEFNPDGNLFVADFTVEVK